MIPRRIFWLIDTTVVAAALAAAYALWPVFLAYRNSLLWATSFLPAGAQGQLGDFGDYRGFVWLIPMTAPLILLVLTELDAYDGIRRMSRTRLALIGPIAMGVAVSVTTLTLFALRVYDWSRLFVFSFVLFGAAGLTLTRVVVVNYYRYRLSRGHYQHNIIAVARPELAEVMRALAAQQYPRPNTWLIGYLTTSTAGTRASRRAAMPATDGGMGAVAARQPAVALDECVERALGESEPLCLGFVETLDQVLVEYPADEVLVAVGGETVPHLPGVLRTCDEVGVPLRLIPEALIECELANLRWIAEPTAQGLPAIALTPRDSNADALQVKRLMDILLSSTLLVVLSPLLAVVAALVRLSSAGPILYPWKVVGQNGRVFTGYKFRTMGENADRMKADLLHLNEMSGPVFKMRRDPRITPVGRWLRKFSLDELPQLISVLKGDMSLVGPRPAGLTELPRYEFWQRRKLSIRPGITCLWQVRGRNSITNFDDWIRMDLEYIDKWSLWLDLKILFWTAIVVVKGTGH